MLGALCYAAIWSRPPSLHGFSLSDTWAWLRYIPAVSAANQLRLRKEWTDVDAHQKTIMSDDLGVGCATWWLSQHLDYHTFCETRHFVKQLPRGFYKLASKRKRGPSKAPDFVALGPRGLAVLECKGTQSNVKMLEKAMDLKHGRAQKTAFQTLLGQSPTDSLVIGLFLAQHKSSEDSTIVIADPPLSAQVKAPDGYSDRLVRIAIAKVYLAKMLSLLNQPHNASLLLKGTADEALKSSGKAALEEWHSEQESNVKYQHYWPTLEDSETVQQSATCNLSSSPELIKQLLSANSLGKFLESRSLEFNEKPKVRSVADCFEMSLPFGFEMRLTLR